MWPIKNPTCSYNLPLPIHHRLHISLWFPSPPPFLCSVFYVIENRIFCCDFDLSDLVSISSNPPPKLRFRSPTIFQREKSGALQLRSLGGALTPMAGRSGWWSFGLTPPTDHHQRNSASSASSSLERFFRDAQVLNPEKN
ncbi:hypothetical protein SESBI_34360 [Sesbania bispinosa]|nr:hypothetical protein SESBI_34360 [Sesbania bispinosa]